MPKSKTMWVVSSGEYSDYRVLAICDSKERAERIAAQNESPYGAARAEEIPYFDRDPAVVPVYHRECVITDRFEVTQERKRDTEEHEVFTIWDEHISTPCRSRVVKASYGHGKAVRIEVGGTDRTRVLKKYSELIAQITSDPTFNFKASR